MFICHRVHCSSLWPNWGNFATIWSKLEDLARNEYDYKMTVDHPWVWEMKIIFSFLLPLATWLLFADNIFVFKSSMYLIEHCTIIQIQTILKSLYLETGEKVVSFKTFVCLSCNRLNLKTHYFKTRYIFATEIKMRSISWA